MGVRESVAQSAEHGGDLNIRDFSFEQKEKETLPFNPEDEVSDEDWKGMLRMLEVYGPREGQGVNAQDFTQLAADMMLLFSNRIAELGLSEENFQYMIEHFGRYDDGVTESWSPAMVLAARLKVLFPDKTPQQIGVSEEIWEEMKTENHLYKGQNLWDGISGTFERMQDMVILHPERKGEMPIDEVFEKAKDLAEKEDSWTGFLNIVSAARIFAPERTKEEIIDKMSQEDWQEIRETIIKDIDRVREIAVKRGDTFMPAVYGGKARELAMVKILMAEKVIVDERGLRLIMPQKGGFQENAPPRPERKKF